MKKKVLTLRIEFSEGSELKDEIFKAIEQEYKGALVTAISACDEFRRLELVEQYAKNYDYMAIDDILSALDVSNIPDLEHWQ